MHSWVTASGYPTTCSRSMSSKQISGSSNLTKAHAHKKSLQSEPEQETAEPEQETAEPEQETAEPEQETAEHEQETTEHDS